MGYKVVIGMEINQPFESGDVVPDNTAIHGDFCCTIISCVGKAPSTLEHDEPSGEMNYNFWKHLLQSSKGFQMLAKHIEQNKKQIIYLNQPGVEEILAQIKTDIPKIDFDYKDRAEWLIFWTTKSIKRYGAHAAIGLF